MLPQPASKRKYLPVLFAIGSTLASALVGVMCIASHTPFQEDDSGLLRLAAEASTNSNRWKAVHILAAGCACSRGVGEHLAARRPVHGLQETAVVIGTAPELSSTLGKAGFIVTSISSQDAVTRFHVQGAPRLVLIDPAGHLRYSGGYSADRIARDGYQEIRIWEQLRAGSHPALLPAYGCAVGQHLQTHIDPLGLKYGKLGAM